MTIGEDLKAVTIASWVSVKRSDSVAITTLVPSAGSRYCNEDRPNPPWYCRNIITPLNVEQSLKVLHSKAGNLHFPSLNVRPI